MKSVCGLFVVLCLVSVTLAVFGGCPDPKEGGEASAYYLNEYENTLGAKCLDGTPGMYYHQPGVGSGVHKWYIHHMGGGWCTNVEDCYNRAHSRLGSSKGWPSSMDLDAETNYFSGDPKINPMMYNWNKVYMVYCDGSSFAGFNNSATSYKGMNIWFRGRGILDATIDDLNTKRNLRIATDVVVSGCSAGGLATYLHLDHWASKLDQGAKVVGLPDSGFFMDYEGPPNYQGYMKWGYSYFNVTSGLNADCVAAYASKPSESWKCYFAQYTSPFIRTPIFALQSRFDAWQIPEILGSRDANLINVFGQNLTVTVINNLLNRPRAGVWLDSCYHHCGGWPNIKIGNEDMPTAFEQFYKTEGRARKFYFQDQKYPCASCCS